MLLKKLNTSDDDLFYSSPDPTTFLVAFLGLSVAEVFSSSMWWSFLCWWVLEVVSWQVGGGGDYSVA